MLLNKMMFLPLRGEHLAKSPLGQKGKVCGDQSPGAQIPVSVDLQNNFILVFCFTFSSYSKE